MIIIQPIIGLLYNIKVRCMFPNMGLQWEVAVILSHFHLCVENLSTL